MAPPDRSGGGPKGKRGRRRSRGRSYGTGEPPKRLEIALPLDELGSEEALQRRVAAKLERPIDELPAFRLTRRSIDARGRHVRFRVELDLEPSEPPALGEPEPVDASRDVDGHPVVIIGDGPAGLFCAYELARAGVACVVLDRGKSVQPRRRDLALLNREGLVDTNSNYCFGEGGAGTYSDGKLYTRTGKKSQIRDVLSVLARHGAPADILTNARPHIGSNKLPKVIQSMRALLESRGVRFQFGAQVVDFELSADRAIRGVVLADGTRIGASRVVLATGHSARDIFELLAKRGATLEAKPFALGVRIEHPQPMVDRAQYGRDAGHPNLPPAYYRLAETVDERGVFSFCMCPGGFIVPAATEPGALVVNGMSLSKRGSPWANSGLVVAIEVADWEARGFEGPLGGVAFQRTIEETAFAAGGGGLRAPATRASDFLAGRASSTVPEGSYRPGFAATNIADVLDVTGHRLAERIRGALGVFERRIPGYASEEGVLVGVESRTSAPVRVPRDRDSLMSPDIPGLYPTGEGAGYAGGIVSAAIDGMKVARAIAKL